MRLKRNDLVIAMRVRCRRFQSAILMESMHVRCRCCVGAIVMKPIRNNSVMHLEYGCDETIVKAMRDEADAIMHLKCLRDAERVEAQLL